MRRGLRLTHLDARGKARMVDVGAKPATLRRARARGKVHLSAAALRQVLDGTVIKGDVLGVARLAGIPRVIGVKEASGNMTQICEALTAVPDAFIVLSGDDALTLPAMAVGARGIISVASNEVPAEMAQMVEAAERGDFAAARQVHTRLLPLLLANFSESNPIPVKAAMARLGLLEEHYRLPMVPPRPE